MFIKVNYFGSYPLGAEVELDGVKIMQSEWNEYKKIVFMFGKKKYVDPFLTQLFYVFSDNKVVFFTAHEYKLGHYHIFAVNPKDSGRLSRKIPCDMNIDYVDEKRLFDDLDEMINQHHRLKNNNANTSSLMEYFFEIHKYICSLEEKGKIDTNSEKSIKYLKDIILNDGPEYALAIEFNSNIFTAKRYIFGVCVRGEPLIKSIKG